MKQFKVALAALFASANIGTAFAGGLLTNTNQSISFLRNPARDAAIAIDGVYSNPAGVAFLGEGFHFGLNWQCAVQTRTVVTTSPYLDHTLGVFSFNQDGTYSLNKNAEVPTKRYRGHATAPCIPSLQAAYNKGPWSFQFNFAVTGGGGKCEFEKGIGTFESAVGTIATQLHKLGVNGYSCDNYMEGSQFYYGVTLGAAYKINEHLSVYGGVRALIGNASYTANINNIQVATANGLQNFGDFINSTNAYLTATSQSLDKSEAQVNAVIAQTKPYYDQYGANYDALKALQNAGQANAQQLQLIQAIEGYQQAVAGQEQIAAGRQQIAAGQAGMAQVEAVVTGDGDNNRNDLNLNCDQSGFGIAPLFGIDYKIGRFNFAAKYEFSTKMSLKNKSNLKASTIDATGQFVDGTSIREDSPALLTVGAQYSPIDIVRLNLGYHHFYDKESKKYGDKQDLLSGGTNEYLGGVEVDVTDRLTISAGTQVTRYGLTDQYMSDVSFVTNSVSVGFGASYQANPNVRIEAAYFKTMYSHYNNTTTNAAGMVTTNDFTRANDVIGVGLVVDL